MTTGETNPAHGGKLVDLVVPAKEAKALREQAPKLPTVTLNSRSLSDLELLAVGGYSPLEGFMMQEDYKGVVKDMHLSSGVPWSMPITLAVDDDDARSISEGDEVALADEGGRILAMMHVREKFGYDKQVEAECVYRTTEDRHPGVAALYAEGDTLLGGPVRVIEVPGHDDFPGYRLTPAQTRAAFKERNWRTIVGFQTRNPVHRAHEYIQKAAMEIVDGLLLHPLVGDTKGDDIPADIRMK
jgi:sulfate adenylyltransferase